MALRDERKAVQQVVERVRYDRRLGATRRSSRGGLHHGCWGASRSRCEPANALSDGACGRRMRSETTFVSST